MRGEVVITTEDLMKFSNINGYMAMSLHLNKSSYFVGDWGNPKVREKIFKKPRKYTVEMQLKSTDGATAVTEYKINIKCSKWELSNEIFKALKDVQADYPDIPIDYSTSYAIIKLNKDN